MKVKRIDIYDFKVTLSESEFSDIKVVSDFDDTPIDEVLQNVILCGFRILTEGESRKES